jgi:hypothetical protein
MSRFQSYAIAGRVKNRAGPISSLVRRLFPRFSDRNLSKWFRTISAALHRTRGHFRDREKCSPTARLEGDVLPFGPRCGFVFRSHRDEGRNCLGRECKYTTIASEILFIIFSRRRVLNKGEMWTCLITEMESHSPRTEGRPNLCTEVFSSYVKFKG